jgi:hypothetical protein
MLSRYYLLFSKEFNTMLSERTSSCLMNVLKSLMRTSNRGAREVIGMKLSRKRQCRVTAVSVGAHPVTQELGSGAALAGGFGH